MHNKCFNENWVNRRHFFIDYKNLQKLGVTGKIYMFIHTI